MKREYLFDNKALTTLIIPLIIEQLLAVLVGLCDSVMIANVGEAAVSGVSLVDQIMVLLINAFSALGTGGAVVAGQFLGHGKKKEACIAATQMVWFITICAIGIMIVVYAGKYLILHKIFGKIDADVMGHANIYLMIVTASIPFIALYNVGAAIFRAMGNSKMSMQVSIIMNIINVTGNALLIYGLHRGAEGVAIPTLVSRMAAAVIITVRLLNESLPVYIERTIHYRVNWQMVRRILSIGVPNGLENSMFQLGKILVLSLVSTFGTYAIAANAVSGVIAQFQIIPGTAVSLAMTTVIARCVGAGDYDQAKYYIKKLLALSAIVQTAVVAFTLTILPLILKIYNLSDITADSVTKIIRFHGLCSLIIWPLSFVLPCAFRAAGDAKACMVISTFSMWVFRIAFSYIIGQNMGLGVFGVWVAMVIDWIFRAFCFVIRYFSGKWKKVIIYEQ